VEDAMLSPTPEVLRNFEELKKMGVQVAIDDFGTAYSNLGYLVRYPVQTLKIDRAFIDQIDLDKRTQGLIRSMIGIGRNLSMAVVAEGVERESQLELLRDMDCDEAQGFLFSPPIPASEYVQVIGELSERLQRTRPPR
jgi:EAL domain-containing protein (putative c-di-GMP-specific phosphodiesterase class I)